MNNIAILLTCHNRYQKTLKCLNSVYSQNESAFSFDVFLVDDGSTDNTQVAVKEKFPQVNVISGDGTLFWNRGMCLAWEEARKKEKYDGYLWLNDDTILTNCALEVIHKCNKEYPGAIVVGSVSCSIDSKDITYGGYNKKKIIHPGDMFVECDTFNGNCVFIPKEVCDKIGYLDPYYRHSMGDFDYSWRAVKNGIKCLVTPVIGTCDRNPPEPCWNKGNLVSRYKKLYSPLGNNPFESFHYFKQQSYIKAVFMFIYIHIRVLVTFVLPKKTF